MIVYHGTDSESAQNILQNGIDLSYGEDSVDNAKGFYTTPSKEFAIRRAESMTEKAKQFRQDVALRPALIEIDFTMPENDNIHVKQFVGCSFEWKEFVFNNRMGKRFLTQQNIKSKNHNLDFKYDVVIDETADAGIAKLISDVRYKKTRGSSPIHELIEKVDISSQAFWGKQISFHTKVALKYCIKSMRIIYLDSDE